MGLSQAYLDMIWEELERLECNGHDVRSLVACDIRNTLMLHPGI